MNTYDNEIDRRTRFPDENKIFQIERFIERQMHSGRIPGLALVIVHGEKTIYQKGFGFADVKSKIPVTNETLFELGSASKAFTGLGILYLKEKGLLCLEDSITKYITWFKARYRGKIVDIKIRDFFYQTSGIPFKTINGIPIAKNDNALERTIKTLSGVELAHFPGEKFLYATINYDVLGLVIEKITGMYFEEFIEKNILLPLELKSTYVDRKKAYSFENMAIGYKLGFFTKHKYDAPTYRGNTPAGYFISNSNDIANWLKVQLGTMTISQCWSKIIAESHIPDQTVNSRPGNIYYAGGWIVGQDEEEFFHGGGNPNFSSFLLLKPKLETGIAVLANLHSDYTGHIGKSVIELLDNEIPTKRVIDFQKNFDTISSAMVILSLLFSISTAICSVVYDISYIHLGVVFCYLIGLVFWLYLFTQVLFERLSLKFIRIWAPFSFIPVLLSISLSLVAHTAYVISIYLF